MYLRPLEPSDVELVSRWYEDVRVLALMGDPPISLAARQQRYQDAVTNAEADVFRFMICLIEDDHAIGRTDLFELDRQHGSCAFGITIGEPDLWGRGLGTDAVNALVDFAFGQLTHGAGLVGHRRAEHAGAGRVHQGGFHSGRTLPASVLSGRSLE